MQLLHKLKTRWGIHSNWQVVIIFVVFGCTGFTSLYVRQYIFGFLGIEDNEPFWFRTIVWLLTVLPAYNVLLLIYGTIFGQFTFFWNFLKKMFGRFVPSGAGRL